MKACKQVVQSLVQGRGSCCVLVLFPQVCAALNTRAGGGRGGGPRTPPPPPPFRGRTWTCQRCPRGSRRSRRSRRQQTSLGYRPCRSGRDGLPCWTHCNVLSCFLSHALLCHTLTDSCFLHAFDQEGSNGTIKQGKERADTAMPPGVLPPPQPACTRQRLRRLTSAGVGATSSLQVVWAAAGASLQQLRASGALRERCA
jgi:hypothetical protein